jgi:hypothetical protein
MIDTIKKKLSPFIGSDCYERIKQFIIKEIKLLKDDNIRVYENIGIKSLSDIDIIDDINSINYYISIKYQHIDNVFSVPNLISIRKAKEILSDPNNNLIYIFVYHNERDIIDIKVQKLESFDWNYLYIQNIGQGQLQVKNTNDNIFNDNISRNEWLLSLKTNAIKYYDNLLLKIIEYKTKWEE